MKRAKIILTIVAILTTIGGSLAFKAKRLTVLFYTRGTTATSQFFVCNAPVYLQYTPDPAGLTTLMASTTSDPQHACGMIKVKENL